MPYKLCVNNNILLFLSAIKCKMVKECAEYHYNERVGPNMSAILHTHRIADAINNDTNNNDNNKKFFRDHFIRKIYSLRYTLE